MDTLKKEGLGRRLKRLIIGRDLDVADESVFHKLSLIAFFAWVGLGADGLSSSCYGPAEAYLALGQHHFLAVFVGLATALTIAVISISYSQIIELFPSGGGGYIVASKLLSPTVGMVSGSALLIDYVLTITLSVASGADAIFSFLPAGWHAWRVEFALAGVVLLTVLNMRGVKESVIPLVPVFMIFVLTHAFAILYGLITHAMIMPEVSTRVVADIQATHAQLGLGGMLLLILRAYSMGAGTYTGIEAVSNGLPILREPKAATGRRTMMYMAVSLAATCFGLLLVYILFNVQDTPGKTLNAVLLEAVTASWGPTWGSGFVWVTLASEALLLFVAAQAGFLDGPRVLANMALDRWAPNKFAMLSDRLVTQNGILVMGGGAFVLMLLTQGRVDLLIVLYSINVFITFVLSQLGMVRHWWQVRGQPHWKKKLFINGLGLMLTGFILISVVVVKFSEGGWATLVVTGTVVGLAFLIKRHYLQTWQLLKKLDVLVETALATGELPSLTPPPTRITGPEARTAVILVNGFNGLGLHTLFNLIRMFTGDIGNFVFIQVAVVDAGTFKSHREIETLKGRIDQELNRYATLVKTQGYQAETVSAIGTDVVHEVMAMTPAIRAKYPRTMFAGGQIVFERETIFTRLLHNYVTFSLQRELFRQGVPFLIMPIRV